MVVRSVVEPGDEAGPVPFGILLDADLAALAQVICQVGQLACQWQDQIAELEINPLFVLPHGSGVIVGDALVALR